MMLRHLLFPTACPTGTFGTKHWAHANVDEPISDHVTGTYMIMSVWTHRAEMYLDLVASYPVLFSFGTECLGTLECNKNKVLSNLILSCLLKSYLYPQLVPPVPLAPSVRARVNAVRTKYVTT